MRFHRLAFLLGFHNFPSTAFGSTQREYPDLASPFAIEPSLQVVSDYTFKVLIFRYYEGNDYEFSICSLFINRNKVITVRVEVLAPRLYQKFVCAVSIEIHFRDSFGNRTYTHFGVFCIRAVHPEERQQEQGCG